MRGNSVILQNRDRPKFRVAAGVAGASAVCLAAILEPRVWSQVPEYGVLIQSSESRCKATDSDSFFWGILVLRFLFRYGPRQGYLMAMRKVHLPRRSLFNCYGCQHVLWADKLEAAAVGDSLSSSRTSCGKQRSIAVQTWQRHRAGFGTPLHHGLVRGWFAKYGGVLPGAVRAGRWELGCQHKRPRQSCKWTKFLRYCPLTWTIAARTRHFRLDHQPCLWVSRMLLTEHRGHSNPPGVQGSILQLPEVGDFDGLLPLAVHLLLQ